MSIGIQHFQEPFVQLGDEAEERTAANIEDSPWIIPLRYITQTKLMPNKNLQYPVNLWLTKAEATIPHQEDELLLLDLELNGKLRRILSKYLTIKEIKVGIGR